MKKIAIALAVIYMLFGSVSLVSAATLTPNQVSAILGLLMAFGVDEATILNINIALGGTAPSVPTQSQPPVATAPTPAIVTGMPTSITIYKLVAEDAETFYYAGDKELASITVNGSAATISDQRHSDNCFMVDGNKICGHWVARFTAIQGASNTIVLTAKDGSTNTTTI